MNSPKSPQETACTLLTTTLCKKSHQKALQKEAKGELVETLGSTITRVVSHLTSGLISNAARSLEPRRKEARFLKDVVRNMSFFMQEQFTTL